jgi:hypothetical protein
MRLTLCFIFLIYGRISLAQISISNAYFPNIGSTLITARANNASVNNLSVLPKGNNNVIWDFSSLRPQSLDTQRFISPNTEGGGFFSEATMTFKPDTNISIPFYRRTDSAFSLVGVRGLEYQGYFIRVDVKLHTPYKERRAPLHFGETHKQTPGFKVTFSPSVAPDSLLRSSPFVVPDSIRITYDVLMHDTIDAWGTMRIPNGEFLVLRERHKESITTKVEILYPSAGWLDVTTVIFTGLSEPFLSERYYQNFWNKDTQEPIAIVETNSQNIIRSINYKAINQRVGVKEFVDLSDKITVSPNPSMTSINLDFDKISIPITSIQVIDITGHLVLYKKIETERNIAISLGSWQIGTYLICLMNKEGQIMGKKLFIKN